jgi:hypothetical protein
MVTNQQLGIGLLRPSRARLQVAEYMMAMATSLTSFDPAKRLSS